MGSAATPGGTRVLALLQPSPPANGDRVRGILRGKQCPMTRFRSHLRLNAKLFLLLGCLLLVNGCQKQVVRPALQQYVQAPQHATKVLAAYMPWFGDGSHMDVGYSSQDVKVLHRQIEEARRMGISGFVVDWNGDRRPFSDKNFGLLQQAAGQSNFQVALLFNEADEDRGEATQDALDALSKAYKDYIGPDAPNRNAYLTYNGHPLIFIFPKHGQTDWNRIREQVNTWSTPPLLFYKDEAPAEFSNVFDGYYAWVHPGPGGWKGDGSDWGEQYLENFYRNMKDKYPGKIAVGAAWPGFDDRRAHWSLNRVMNYRCGKTFDDTLRLYRRHYDDSNPLPMLLVETWNDYEEGTAIERPPAPCAGK
jgi:hypothetical protein